jgi:hypothetical protein
MGSVVAAPQGISVVDHIRRRVRKKTNRQMEPGWTGIVVIVARIDMEPHVTWDIVLNQVLEGDELVAVSVDNLSEPSLVQVEGTGVWRNGQNTRLAGAIGVTIGLRGDVVELRTCSRDPDALPDQIKELMRTRVDSQCGRLLPAVLSGGTDDRDENPRGE